jgi:hypothetical protein
MDPITVGAGLASTALNLYGSNKERKMRERAAKLAEMGVSELKGGKGYNADTALDFLGLTDRSNYDSMDPRSKEASMTALEALVKRGSGSGLDIQSRQALSEANARAGGATEAARRAVMQDFMQRGQSGGGAELAGMLAAQQGNYGQLGASTGAAAAAAEQRRLEANVLASRAGQQQQQLEQQTAAAKDTLQRFNVGARQNTLDLENRYRQGAAGSYDTAARTLGGMAPQAGKPYSAMGYGIGQLGEGINSVSKLFGGSSSSYDPNKPDYENQSEPGYGGSW